LVRSVQTISTAAEIYDTPFWSPLRSSREKRKRSNSSEFYLEEEEDEYVMTTRKRRVFGSSNTQNAPRTRGINHFFQDLDRTLLEQEKRYKPERLNAYYGNPSNSNGTHIDLLKPKDIPLNDLSFSGDENSVSYQQDLLLIQSASPRGGRNNSNRGNTTVFKSNIRKKLMPHAQGHSNGSEDFFEEEGSGEGEQQEEEENEEEENNEEDEEDGSGEGEENEEDEENEEEEEEETDAPTTPSKSKKASSTTFTQTITSLFQNSLSSVTSSIFSSPSTKPK
jgi:hypothetical protein